MNYISFSLFGSDPKYCVGALRNVQLARQLYPGWRCVFFCDDSVPQDILRQLQAGADVRMVTPAIAATVPRKLWRSLINDDPSCLRYLVRDADSRLNEREAASVSAWIKSGKSFLSQRDHPCHARPINGGMWGAMRLISLISLIRQSGPHDLLGSDQDFLCRFLWPLVCHDCLQHDSVTRHFFPGSMPFPTPRSGLRFVGEVWEILPDGTEAPRETDLWGITPGVE